MKLKLPKSLRLFVPLPGVLVSREQKSYKLLCKVDAPGTVDEFIRLQTLGRACDVAPFVGLVKVAAKLQGHPATVARGMKMFERVEQAANAVSPFMFDRALEGARAYYKNKNALGTGIKAVLGSIVAGVIGGAFVGFFAGFGALPLLAPLAFAWARTRNAGDRMAVLREQQNLRTVLRDNRVAGTCLALTHAQAKVWAETPAPAA